MIKKCKICGTEFETKTRSRYCSEECRRAFKYDWNHKWYQRNREKILAQYREKTKIRQESRREQQLVNKYCDGDCLNCKLDECIYDSEVLCDCQ